MASGLHRNEFLKVRTDKGGSDEHYGGGAVTFQAAEGGAWNARACSQQRKRGAWRRVDECLISAPVRVAVARRGTPDQVVAGEN